MTSRSAYYMTDAMVAGFMETPFFHAPENVTNPTSEEPLPSTPLSGTGAPPGAPGAPPGAAGATPEGPVPSPINPEAPAKPGVGRKNTPSERTDGQSPTENDDKIVSNPSDENDREESEDIKGTEEEENEPTEKHIRENELWNEDSLTKRAIESKAVDTKEAEETKPAEKENELWNEGNLTKSAIEEGKAVKTEIVTEENEYYEFPDETEETSEASDRRKRQSDFFHLGPTPRKSSLRARPEGGAAGGSSDEGKAQTLKGSTTIQDFWDVSLRIFYLFSK